MKNGQCAETYEKSIFLSFSFFRYGWFCTENFKNLWRTFSLMTDQKCQFLVSKDVQCFELNAETKCSSLQFSDIVDFVLKTVNELCNWTTIGETDPETLITDTQLARIQSKSIQGLGQSPGGRGGERRPARTDEFTGEEPITVLVIFGFPLGEGSCRLPPNSDVKYWLMAGTFLIQKTIGVRKKNNRKMKK